MEMMRHCQHDKLGNEGQTAWCKELGMQEQAALPVGEQMDSHTGCALGELADTQWACARRPTVPFLQEGHRLRGPSVRIFVEVGNPIVCH